VTCRFLTVGRHAALISFCVGVQHARAIAEFRSGELSMAHALLGQHHSDDRLGIIAGTDHSAQRDARTLVVTQSTSNAMSGPPLVRPIAHRIIQMTSRRRRRSSLPARLAGGVDAIAANRDPAILRSAGCIEGNGPTLRRFRTCDDRAWRDRSTAEARDRFQVRSARDQNGA
jgi:hypothetical protein